MSKIFYVGFFLFVASTIAFIVAILTPYWIVKVNPSYRGIFEVCDRANLNSDDVRLCAYILLNPSDPSIATYRTGRVPLVKKLIYRNYGISTTKKKHTRFYVLPSSFLKKFNSIICLEFFFLTVTFFIVLLTAKYSSSHALNHNIH